MRPKAMELGLKAVFDETETEAVETWVGTTKPYLNDVPITEVATRIRDLVRHNAEGSEILEREARYFEKHAERMRYREFREKGYQIGSGVIESAYKHVVAQRCRGASMRWTDEGLLETISEVRSLFQSTLSQM